MVGLDLHGNGDDIIECDVRDQASVDAAVAAAIEKLGGGVDVVINNAGVGNPQSAGEPPDDDALAVIDINLMGAWRVTSAALPALRESRGRVVEHRLGPGPRDVAVRHRLHHVQARPGGLLGLRCAWSTPTG